MAKRHSTLRTEKNCLNCGHDVEDRYCSHCGQENLVIHDSTFHLLMHYVQDLFHYDGRFWHTINNLVRKPGQIPLEYIEGKRRNNIEPIKLYVFASTVFFLFFFIVAKWEMSNPEADEIDYSQRLISLQREKEFLKGSPDTVLINHLQSNLIRLDTALTIPVDSGSNYKIDLFGGEQESDSLSGFSRWIERRINAKVNKLNDDHSGNEMRMVNAFLLEFMKKTPQLLFVSMPFFALLLLLLYINRRNRNYVEHFIFSTYHYAYLFICLTLLTIVDMIMRAFSTDFADRISVWLIAALVLYLCVYLALSMKRFYGGRWWTLLFRYFVLGFLFFWLLVFLSFGLLIVTAIS